MVCRELGVGNTPYSSRNLSRLSVGGATKTYVMWGDPVSCRKPKFKSTAFQTEETGREAQEERMVPLLMRGRRRFREPLRRAERRSLSLFRKRIIRPRGAGPRIRRKDWLKRIIQVKWRRLARDAMERKIRR